MSNAAPFIAPPWKRVIAGAIDLILCAILWVIVTSAISESQPGGFWVTHLAAIASAVYLVYHFAFFWYLADATPGLRALDMRIVRTSGGGALSIAQMLLRPAIRPLMLWGFFWSADFALWPFFRAEPVLLAPLFLELGMMFTLPSRQTLSDLVAGTLVVNVPPPQPHRAPAGPMYSPSDAEFGLPPGGRK